MARGRRSRGAKARKPARGRKPAKRAKSAARKPAKRSAAKSKARKVPAKRAVAKKPRVKKAAPPKPRKLEVDVIDVETIEEVAPGVAVVTDYEIVGVHPAPEKKTDEPGSQNS